MQKVQVCLQGKVNAAFNLNWPAAAPIPRAGEGISLDGLGGGIDVQIVEVVHFVHHESMEIEIFLYGKISPEITKERLVAKLKEIPFVGKIYA